ncbi:unnamed protein product [Lathyrus sativus]|nr:unnamed protein product [Lathyrus sativus]
MTIHYILFLCKKEKKSMERQGFNSMLFTRGLEYRRGLGKSIDSFDPIDKNNDDPDISDGSDISDLLEIDLSDTPDTDYLYNPFADTSDISDPLEISDTSDPSDTYYIDYIDGSDISDPLETSDLDYINDPDGSDRSDPLETLDPNYINDPDGSDISDPLETLETSDPDYINDPDGSDRSDPLEIYDTSDTDICKKDSHDNSKIDMLAKMNQYSHLWVLCETCSGLNFKQFLVAKMSIYEYCGEHLKMISSDRIELLIDPGTWNLMDEDMVSLDPIKKFDSIEKIPILQWDPIAFDLIFVDPPEE